ncbi:MAG TPA: M20/M25/M40 family metallo-hydrolase [Gemmatimonadaceae bacterium]|nr:M20/M25/M40 family metallo-hydrolase [Gemmatimonadaceae bacterium]
MPTLLRQFPTHRAITPRRVVVSSLLALLALVPAAAAAQQAAAGPDMAKLQDEAVSRIEQYIRINTTNPPGSEDQTMKFFARIFTAEGIPFDTASSAPGRGNVWARLKGGPQPALVLLSHMDVVPADPKYWSVDPFAATVKDGYIWGRGTLDTKTLGIVELEAFLALHRAKVPLDRDVIFMATADEEAGAAFGAGWVMDHHPEAFAGAGFVLNEGGGGSVDQGRQQFGIEVTQKVPFWFKLTATGTPRHGSEPQVASAANRLIRSLYRLQTYQFAPRIIPAVDAYFKGLAPTAAPQWKDAFLDMAKTIQDPDALLRLQTEMPELAALTRNTCSITVLRGSDKINVIPPEASAQLDCRLLPDQNVAEFKRELSDALNDPGITVDQILGFTPAVSSTDSPLYKTLVEVTKQHYPDAAIVPAVSTGFTDSHFFRDRGIASYGYAPFLIPEADESGVHGNNERISVQNVRTGTQMMWEIVKAMVSR